MFHKNLLLTTVFVLFYENNKILQKLAPALFTNYSY